MKVIARFALALPLMVGLSAPSVATEFYAIVDNFGRRPLIAYLDVAVDAMSAQGSPPEVMFEVFDSNGTEIAELIVLAHDGFASTFSAGDLFDWTDGRPILVRGTTTNLAATSGAALHLELRGAHVVVGALQNTRLDGTQFGSGRVFSVPLGSFEKAALMIANVSHSDISVESFRGAKGADGSGTVLTARLPVNQVHRVDLTQNDAFSNFIINSSGLIIVQVVIDNGKTIQSYMVPPVN